MKKLSIKKPGKKNREKLDKNKNSNNSYKIKENYGMILELKELNQQELMLNTQEIMQKFKFMKEKKLLKLELLKIDYIHNIVLIFVCISFIYNKNILQQKIYLNI